MFSTIAEKDSWVNHIASNLKGVFLAKGLCLRVRRKGLQFEESLGRWVTIGSSKLSIHKELKKARSNLAARQARPCLLLAQVKQLPLKPISLSLEAVTMSSNSLTEGEEGRQMLSFSE